MATNCSNPARWVGAWAGSRGSGTLPGLTFIHGVRRRPWHQSARSRAGEALQNLNSPRAAAGAHARSGGLVLHVLLFCLSFFLFCWLFLM